MKIMEVEKKVVVLNIAFETHFQSQGFKNKLRFAFDYLQIQQNQT